MGAGNEATQAESSGLRAAHFAGIGEECTWPDGVGRVHGRRATRRICALSRGNGSSSCGERLSLLVTREASSLRGKALQRAVVWSADATANPVDNLWKANHGRRASPLRWVPALAAQNARDLRCFQTTATAQQPLGLSGVWRADGDEHVRWMRSSRAAGKTRRGRATRGLLLCEDAP